MLVFEEVQLDQKEKVNEILSKCHNMSCEFCFGNHFIWKKAYNEKICFTDGFYIIQMENDEYHENTSFLYPAGNGDTKTVIEKLLDYCEQTGKTFVLHSAYKEDTEELERLFPGKFEFSLNKDFSDYVYNQSDLATLGGKKYHGKRNHVKRFKENNNWKFEPITDDNFEDCLKMNKKWCRVNDCAHHKSLSEESCAVKQALDHFKDLDFFGGLLKVDGEVCAFTIAEKLNDDTVVVHIEKAFSDVEGAYPTINQQFAENMCSEYKYINREEDLGIEGLRKAKESYHPEMLVDKYIVRLK